MTVDQNFLKILQINMTIEERHRNQHIKMYENVQIIASPTYVHI